MGSVPFQIVILSEERMGSVPFQIVILSEERMGSVSFQIVILSEERMGSVPFQIVILSEVRTRSVRTQSKDLLSLHRLLLPADNRSLHSGGQSSPPPVGMTTFRKKDR